MKGFTKGDDGDDDGLVQGDGMNWADTADSHESQQDDDDPR